MKTMLLCLLMTALSLLIACGEVDKKDETTFMVSFDSHGGSVVAAQTVVKDAYATEPAAPTLAEHVFVAWYREAAYLTAWNFTNDPVTNDLTLHAQWSRYSAGLEFVLTNGGDAYAVGHGSVSSAVVHVPESWLGKPVVLVMAFQFGETGPGGIRSVHLPAGITGIGAYGFNSNSDLTNVTIYATTPPDLGSECFELCAALDSIRVPAGSVAAYQAAWTSVAGLIQAIP